MSILSPYPIGTPGQAWGTAELAQWRARQVRQRSYADLVLAALQPLREAWELLPYGEVVYAAPGYEEERFALMALRSPAWNPAVPSVLVTGGVHGYETSGVLGALQFARDHAARYAGRLNLLVVPCVSPWAFERIQRWNFDAIDPNRSFKPASAAQESAALTALVAPLRGQFIAHIDLHETPDTDESEYRPAVAARDGKAFEPGTIPDGFYLVDDSDNPQPAFQQAILRAVARVTHIAEADTDGTLIGTPQAAPGVIDYPVRDWGLCTAISGARYTSITEVYPDSPRATPAQCTAAQVAAVCAGLEFVLAQRS